MGRSFREQISCQIVDVTKPWRATPGKGRTMKTDSMVTFHEKSVFMERNQEFEWYGMNSVFSKHRVHPVPFKFSIKCFEFKMMQDSSFDMVTLASDSPAIGVVVILMVSVLVVSDWVVALASMS